MVLTGAAVEFQCCKWKKNKKNISWIWVFIQKDKKYGAKI